MASVARRLRENVPGDVFVDDTCIDCGTCRWMQPEVFAAGNDAAYVAHQPEGPAQLRRSLQALVACPTGSIGTVSHHDLAPVVRSFPAPIDGPVHHVGFHSEDSFGAASYLIERTDGAGQPANVLVDSPRFSRPLVRALEDRGGVRWMFLTHRDDVADHARFHAHFGCERILHRADVRPSTADVEVLLDGTEPIDLEPELRVIPVPGHTPGSACLLHHRYLFTGDHLAYSPTLGHPYAFRDACWYDWSALVRSMERLATERFEWILPGHGWPCHRDAAAMRHDMQRCLAWLRRA